MMSTFKSSACKSINPEATVHVHSFSYVDFAIIEGEENKKAKDDISSQAVVCEFLVTHIQKSKPLIITFYY